MRPYVIIIIVVFTILFGLLGFRGLKIIQDQNAESARLSEEVELLKQQQGENAISRQNSVPGSNGSSTEKEPEEQNVGREFSNAEVIAKVKPAVVYVETPYGAGSGMIIDSNGLVLTNAHVIRESAQVIVHLASGASFPVISLATSDQMSDIAILRINANDLPSVQLGDSSQVQQGDEVFSFGFPFGIKGDVSFKEGTISRRFQQEGVDYLETSAEVHPGNSGGPLVNRLGEIVGVVTGKFGQSVNGILLGESIKFAIPINAVKSKVPTLTSNMRPLTDASSACTTFKAKGFVTLYNETPEERRLVPSVRLVSQEGLLFRIDESVILPPGNELVPGKIEVSVTAAEVGARYIIGPSSFSLPGLAGSPLYAKIYAKSFSSMRCL